VYKIAGGAALYLNSCDAGCGSPVAVSQVAIDHNGTPLGATWHLNTVPADGTTLETPSSETGRIYKVAGGAPLYLNSCDADCGSPVEVNQYTIDNRAVPLGAVPHLNIVPANGVFLRGWDTGAIYRIAGGAPIYISDCGAIGFAGCDMPFVSVMQYTIANSGAPAGGAAHLNVVPANGTLLLGLPSNTVWEVVNGERQLAGSSSSAVGVNDASLSSIPILASTASSGSSGSGGSGSIGSGGSPTSLAHTGVVPGPSCVVPNLHHMVIAGVRRALTKAHCRLGTIHKPKHVRRHHMLRVIRQSSRPRTNHRLGYPVGVTLK